MPLFPSLLLSFAAATATAPAPPQLGLCASCHGDDGCRGLREIPRIAAQNPEYLAAALNAYRDGRRDHAAMQAIAGALSTRDVATLAEWYGLKPACVASP